jgi:TolA-binding protein
VALQSYQDRLFDPAFAGFELYILSCPQGTYVGQAHYLLGDMLAQQSDCAKALPHVDEALRHALPSEIRPHAQLLGARCALQLDKLDLAQTFLQEAVKAPAPVNLKAAASYWLGEVALRQQRYAAAPPHYRAAIAAAPTGEYAPHAYYALGWLARQRGDAAAALEAFEALLRLAPTHALAAQVRFARADLLRQTGQIEAAAEAFKQLAQDATGPSQDEVLFRWAEMAYQLRRYQEARTAYGRLVQTFPHSSRVPESLLGLGWIALQQQQCDAVVAAWEKLLEREPDFAQAPDLHYHLGTCYLHLDQEPQARFHFQQVVEAQQDTPQHHEAVIRLAALAYRRQDYPEAIRYYAQALNQATEADRFRLHYLLGESYDARGDTIQALTHWQHALEGPPTLPFYATALYRLGRTHLRQGDWAQAISVLRRLWDDFPQFPERPSVALGLAQAYMQTHDCVEALPFYTAIADANAPGIDSQVVRRARVACLFSLQQYADIVALLAPTGTETLAAATEPALLYTLGQAYMQLQQFDHAAQVFALLQEGAPEHALVAAMLPRYAYALERLGRPGEALTLWQTHLAQGAIEDAAERARLQLHAGRLALQVQRFEDALRLLGPVRHAASSAAAAEARYWLGEAWRQQRQWGPAIETYQDLLHHHATDLRWATLARLRLGTIYEQQQQWEQALAIYRRVRETATDTRMIATAQQRIDAIEAGRHSGLVPTRPLAAPARSSKG